MTLTTMIFIVLKKRSIKLDKLSRKLSLGRIKFVLYFFLISLQGSHFPLICRVIRPRSMRIGLETRILKAWKKSCENLVVKNQHRGLVPSRENVPLRSAIGKYALQTVTACTVSTGS